MNSQIFNKFLHADYLIEAETLDFLTYIDHMIFTKAPLLFTMATDGASLLSMMDSKL